MPGTAMAASERPVQDRQADGLRRAAGGGTLADGTPAWPVLPALAITGGKGGVGKTSTAVNLAVALARRRQRVLLVDFDLGLANADLLLGVEPQATLADVLAGRASVAAAIHATPWGVDLLPAASGLDELTRLGEERLRRLLVAIAAVARGYDRCLIDTAAGIGAEVLAPLRAASRSLCVVTPDPTSLTDSYALLKLMAAHGLADRVRLCINLADDLAQATATSTRLRAVCARYLGRDLPLAGWIPRDPLAAEAVRRRTPFAAGSGASGPPSGAAAAALTALAARLHGESWSA